MGSQVDPVKNGISPDVHRLKGGFVVVANGAAVVGYPPDRFIGVGIQLQKLYKFKYGSLAYSQVASKDLAPGTFTGLYT